MQYQIVHFISIGVDNFWPIKPINITSKIGSYLSSIQSDDCEPQWTAPEGKTGADAELMMDLQCRVTLNVIRMKNGGAGEGIKEFTLWGAKTMDGPWVKLIASEMTKDNAEACQESLLFSKNPSIFIRNVQ